MNSLLLKNIPKDQHDKARTDWDGCKPSLDSILIPTLLALIEESIVKADKEDNYNKPNTFPFLADQAGYRRALRKIIKLIGE